MFIYYIIIDIKYIKIDINYNFKSKSQYGGRSRNKFGMT